jgi:hypothetical protein
VPQAAWHSGEELAGETRAMEERGARRVERGAEGRRATGRRSGPGARGGV